MKGTIECCVPWDAYSSSELSSYLRVPIQVLANWRSRGCGPLPAPEGLFKGRYSFYILADVRTWQSLQSGAPRPRWFWFAEWLEQHFHLPQSISSEAETRRALSEISCLHLFPLKNARRASISRGERYW